MVLRKYGRRAAGGVLASLLLVLALIGGCGRQGAEPQPAVLPGMPSQGDAAGTASGRGPDTEDAAATNKPFMIRTNPSGARVYVDGELLGETPVPYPHRDGKQHQLYFTLKGFGIQRDDRPFQGEGVTVDLVPVSRATDQQWQVLAAQSLLPEVRSVINPAGNKTWQVMGSLACPLGSLGGRYLVGTVTRAEGKALRSDLVAVDLHSGTVRQVVSRLFEEYPFQYAGPIISLQPAGWLNDKEVVVLTQRTLADNPENPVLTALKVNVATGRQEPLGDLGQSAEGLDEVRQAWLTGDQKALFIQSSTHIFGLDLSTGARLPDFMLPLYWGFTVKPSPDGWAVAYGQPHEDGTPGVAWLDLRNGRAHALSGSDVYAQGFWWSVDGRYLAYGISRRRADGSYPVLPEEETALLLPDVIEVVDLASLTKRQVPVPVSPAVVLSASNPERMVLMHANVAENQPGTSFGWRLIPRGLARLNALTGEVTPETPLHLPEKAYVLSARAYGEDYLLVYQTAFRPELAYVPKDGRIEPRTGEVVAGSEIDGSGGVDGALLLLQSATGLGYATSGRLLLGGELGQGAYFYLPDRSPQGWVLLHSQDRSDVLYLVNEPLLDI